MSGLAWVGEETPENCSLYESEGQCEGSQGGHHMAGRFLRPRPAREVGPFPESGWETHIIAYFAVHRASHVGGSDGKDTYKAGSLGLDPGQEDTLEKGAL